MRRQFAALLKEAFAEQGALADAPIRAASAMPVSPAEATPTTTAQVPAEADARLEERQTQASGYLADERFGPYEPPQLLAGLTPAAWLRELRLDQARQLLEAGGFGTVAAVTAATGFCSARRFSDLYIERFGRRPSEYRAPR